MRVDPPVRKPGHRAVGESVHHFVELASAGIRQRVDHLGGHARLLLALDHFQLRQLPGVAVDRARGIARHSLGQVLRPQRPFSQGHQDLSGRPGAEEPEHVGDRRPSDALLLFGRPDFAVWKSSGHRQPPRWFGAAPAQPPQHRLRLVATPKAEDLDQKKTPGGCAARGLVAECRLLRYSSVTAQVPSARLSASVPPTRSWKPALVLNSKPVTSNFFSSTIV